MTKMTKQALSWLSSAAIAATMLTSFSITASAETVTAAYSDGKLTFTASDACSAAVYVATYDGDTLSGVSMTTASVTVGTNEISVAAAANDKIFVWTNDGNNTPITAAVTVAEEEEGAPADATGKQWKFVFGSDDTEVADGEYLVTASTTYDSMANADLQYGLYGAEADDYKVDRCVDGITAIRGQQTYYIAENGRIGAYEVTGNEEKGEMGYGQIAGLYPTRFSMKAENNAYYEVRATVTGLDDTKSAKVTLYSEKRYPIVTDMELAAGESKTLSFTATTQPIYIKSPGYTYNDNVVNVMVVGSNAALASVEIYKVDHRTTVWCYTDSTGCNYQSELPFFEYQNYGGTAQYLSKYLPKNIVVANQGEGGLNAADNMHFNAAKANIKAGDYVYVQYGHNHKSDGVLGYLNAINASGKYYKYAHSVGAYTIYVGPIDRHNSTQYNATTNTWSSTLGGYSKAAKYYTELLICGGTTLAEEFVSKANAAANGTTGIDASVYEWADAQIANGITADGVTDVAFIDLNQPTLDWLSEVCEDVKTRGGYSDYKYSYTNYYFQGVKGGAVDGTHANDLGADCTAKMFFDGIKALDTSDAIEKVEYDVLSPLVKNMRAATPYKVSDERIAAGLPTAGYPDIYTSIALPEYPTDIISVDWTDANTISSVAIREQSSSISMDKYGQLKLVIYDSNGAAKGTIKSTQVDNTWGDSVTTFTVGGSNALTGDTSATYDPSAGDTFTAQIFAADDTSSGLSMTSTAYSDEFTQNTVKWSFAEYMADADNISASAAITEVYTSVNDASEKLNIHLNDGDEIIGDGLGWSQTSNASTSAAAAVSNNRYIEYTPTQDCTITVAFQGNAVNGNNKPRLYITEGTDISCAYKDNTHIAYADASGANKLGTIKASLTANKTYYIWSYLYNKEDVKFTISEIVVSHGKIGEYKINAVDADNNIIKTLLTGEAMVSNDFTVTGLNEVISVTENDTTTYYWLADSSVSAYSKTFTMGDGSETYVGTITYEKGEDITAYFEAENLSNSTAAASDTCSGSKYAHINGSKTGSLGTLDAGTYNITVVLSGNDTSSIKRGVYIRDINNSDANTNTIKDTSGNNVAFAGSGSTDGTYTKTFTLTEAANVVVTGYTTASGGYNQSAEFDYIIIEKPDTTVSDYKLSGNRQYLRADDTLTLTLTDVVNTSGKSIAADISDAEINCDTAGVNVNGAEITIDAGTFAADTESDLTAVTVTSTLGELARDYTFYVYSADKYAYYDDFANGIVSAGWNGDTFTIKSNTGIVFPAGKITSTLTLPKPVSLDAATKISYIAGVGGSDNNTCGQPRYIEIYDSKGTKVINDVIGYSWGDLYVGGTVANSAINSSTGKFSSALTKGDWSNTVEITVNTDGTGTVAYNGTSYAVTVNTAATDISAIRLISYNGAPAYTARALAISDMTITQADAE